ncbi:MAG: Na(+)/H(+) antiporter subunit B [Bdellovibrionota bacterium]
MLEFIILFVLVVFAFTALNVENLFTAVVVLGSYSFLTCVLLAKMLGVDVAFTEACVGAGISTVLMIATLCKVGIKTKD